MHFNLNCFQCFAIKNHAIMNYLVHICFYTVRGGVEGKRIHNKVGWGNTELDRREAHFNPEGLSASNADVYEDFRSLRQCLQSYSTVTFFSPLGNSVPWEAFCSPLVCWDSYSWGLRKCWAPISQEGQMSSLRHLPEFTHPPQSLQGPRCFSMGSVS